MKNRHVLFLGILLSFFFVHHIVAQDAQSVILPAPWSSALGGQLIYFYEDGSSTGGTPSGSRGNWRSSLVLTNVHPSAKVKIHFQFYDSSLTMLMDFADNVNAGQRVVIDPQDIRRPSDNGPAGSITNGIYLLAATPVNQEFPAGAKVIPFNWLTGEVSIRSVDKNSNTVYNALSRQAVYAGVPQNGSRIDPNYGVVAGPEGNALFLDGSNRLFQQFRPQTLLLGNLFSPGSLTSGVPFGNRLTFLGFQDSYTDPFNPWVMQSANVTVTTFEFDNLEQAFSVPSRICSGLREYTISPNTFGAAGNFPDFLGPAYNLVIQNGGWLRMTTATFPAGANLLGWFSQAKSGTDGGGDLLTGEGRKN